MFFCICSDRVALDRRSSIQDATNICLEHPQSWSPKNLTVCARLIKVLPPALKIEDLLYCLLRIFHPGQPSSPQKTCKVTVKMSTTFFLPGQMQAVQAHIHNLTLTRCTPGLAAKFCKSSTWGKGTHCYVMSLRSCIFMLTRVLCRIPCT